MIDRSNMMIPRQSDPRKESEKDKKKFMLQRGAKVI